MTEALVTEYGDLPVAAVLHDRLHVRLLRLWRSVTTVPETVRGLLSVDASEFAELAGVGGHDAELLMEVQEQLPGLLAEYVERSNDIVVGKDVSSSASEPQAIEPLSDDKIPVRLLTDDVKFNKLARRIESVTSLAATVAVVESLDADEFGGIPGVGRIYVRSLVRLKAALPSLLENFRANPSPSPTATVREKIVLSADRYALNVSQLTRGERRVMQKLRKSFAYPTVSRILTFDPSSLREWSGVGRKTIRCLAQLQSKIIAAMREPLPTWKAPVGPPDLFVSAAARTYSLPLIEEMIISDFEALVASLDSDAVEILLSRLSFTRPRRTLEQLGEERGVTRERIRQIEGAAKAMVPASMRVSPSVLWASVREHLQSDLSEEMPYLARCFDRDADFFAFLEVCCDVVEDTIAVVQDIDKMSVPSRMLEDFFSRTPSPVPVERLLDELSAGYGYAHVRGKKVLRLLVQKGNVALGPQGVVPRRLLKESAIAHVLLDYPRGLPWSDAARSVNSRGISRARVLERALDGAFGGESVYKSAQGSYRHVNFLELEHVDVSKVLEAVWDHVESLRQPSANLHNVYESLRSFLTIDYWELRHIVREFGEEVGIHFDGRSTNDTVALTEAAPRVTRGEIILRILERSPTPLTIAEIAQKTRSKNTSLVAQLLLELRTENKAVRVDKLMYTTPAKAFASVDVSAVAGPMNELIQSTPRIIEADVFRERLNKTLHLSYSKYFYVALAHFVAARYRWHCSGSLVASELIPGPSIRALFRGWLDWDASPEVNEAAVCERVWFTHHMLTSRVRTWIRDLLEAGQPQAHS